MWTLDEAVELARRIEIVAPLAGAHIGLTGGCLYKSGPRKDLDFLVYRIRQRKEIDRKKFFAFLEAIDIHIEHDYGFVVKAVMAGARIDFLFPESPGKYYRARHEG